MNTGNLPPSTDVNKTTSFFDSFFDKNLTVTQDVNDAVVGFFQTITGDKDVGLTLAGSVIYTAKSQGIDPMELIDQFRGLDANELNAYLTMFFNINRAGTSLLGITNQPQTNKYVQRAILP